MKSSQSLALVAALAGSASAFTPVHQQAVSTTTALFNGKGAGGMADTRDPEAFNDDDARKSISAAPSFEEYLKSRDTGGADGVAYVSSGKTSTGMDVSGNAWKPDSEKMGSTDTGDYFPEGYNADDQIDFTSGMMGSQSGGSQRDGPQLPGLENLGADAMVAGGLVMDSEIPADMEFIPSSVPDGSHEFQVASTGTGEGMTIEVKPVCMTFEDYYAAFSKDSHPSLSVSPAVGRMDRRGGETTLLDITCAPNGVAGNLEGDLVINLPEDNSKICFKITARSV
ncbi:unnamed protein product [Cylindrotheca closterium]|uniref:Uncharacterized protein n=1 Tax=Cylindrotheca closterium TaxID=2856 RepID=A0AAD2FUC6_9STRA|nr:unnamed protein product [Cylindrotheca closterium]